MSEALIVLRLVGVTSRETLIPAYLRSDTKGSLEWIPADTWLRNGEWISSFTAVGFNPDDAEHLHNQLCQLKSEGDYDA